MIAESTAAGAPPLVRTPTLMRAEYDALVSELHQLRARRGMELARRLREAREYGSPGEDGDVLSVLEEVSLDESRIAQLEDLVRDAPIADMVDDGVASVGCTVRVANAAGEVAEYRLVGRRSDDAGRYDISPASPMGSALIGSVAGDAVRVLLPTGRLRELRVLAVFATLAADGGTGGAAVGAALDPKELDTVLERTRADVLVRPWRATSITTRRGRCGSRARLRARAA